MFLKKQKFVRRTLIVVTLTACIVATQHYQARPDNCAFNPRQIGRLESGMWQSYYEGRWIRLGSHPLCGEVARAEGRPDAPWTMWALSPVFQALALKYLPGLLRDCLGFPNPNGPNRLWKILHGSLPPMRRIAPPLLAFAPHYRRAKRSHENDALPTFL